MAINQNHLFEDLNGVKCAVVEKNASIGRVEFLRGILGFNGYEVVVVASPPPKAVAGIGAAGSAAGPSDPVIQPVAPPAPETFTIGVTDVSFNPINAIFGRLLKTPDGHVVTLAYWQQKEDRSNDSVPYFESR
jgi:hypothetical protein